MNGDLGKAVESAVQNQERAGELVDKLIAVAQPGSVFSQPVTAGEYTLINASEVSAAAGVGFGVGAGGGPARRSDGARGGRWWRRRWAAPWPARLLPSPSDLTA